MDVEPGLCWRCEKKKATKKCSECKIGEYCGNQCMERDKLRHKAECDMLNENKECAYCHTKTKCKVCTACKEATYCKRECQEKHWSSHKQECKQIRKMLIERANTYRQAFTQEVQRLVDYPHYIGNTLAVDVLKLGLNEATPDAEGRDSELARDYNILLAGVGDLRNLLLTTASLPSNFTGNVRFTLNDIDPFVLARNVLFLYIIITQRSRESIETSITNIWYSLQIPKTDYQLLMSVLDELLKHTKATLKEKTSGQLILEEDDIKTIKEVWGKWREMECDTAKPDSIKLSQQRAEMFKKEPQSSEGMSDYIVNISPKYRKSARTYFRDGLFLPQNQNVHKINTKVDNPTLTGRPRMVADSQLHKEFAPSLFDFVYCIRSDALPFLGWDGIPAQKSFQQDSIVALFHRYISSVIKSASSILHAGRIQCIIKLKNCTDLHKDYEPNFEPKFDRITTSNIADYIGIKALLSTLRPLLSTTNKHAVLITETMNWVLICPEANLMDKERTRSKFTELSPIMIKDTGRLDMIGNIICLYDYFDTSNIFLRYLRILFLATTDDLTLRDTVPSLTKAFNMEGFRLRNFTNELNKVVPFVYRIYPRLINNCVGRERYLEWQLDLPE
ncbi:uncharacterized protein [Antedon mediterranea]|uniref:uncharacterized protein n=1 Tax=Antedon mediterranea TaxID=105859 RepID=UPI003AF8514E